MVETMHRELMLIDKRRVSFYLAWHPDRWGASVTALAGRWGFHIYLDICQAQLAFEIHGKA